MEISAFRAAAMCTNGERDDSSFMGTLIFFFFFLVFPESTNLTLKFRTIAGISAFRAATA